MKRLIITLALILCCAVLVFPVSAQSRADRIKSETSVTADGGCNISISATISLEEPTQRLMFPIPAGATDVTLNGADANCVTSASGLLVRLTDITGGMAGEFSFALHYRLHGVVSTTEEGQMLLQLPILSGFAYPVENLEFTVTLPGEISGRPQFVSAYHQENAGSLLNVSVSGATITGSALESLKDHETLTMTLEVDEKLFPQTAAAARVLGVMDLAIIISALLAVAYYIATLRPAIPKKRLRPTAPDGINAGDIALWFTGGSMDLSMLVVTWAQLGYLRIQVDDSGRVLLHKRMDMGNERSAFENRCYKNLFGRRRIVDGTGYHYAQLCRTVAKKSPLAREVYLPKSGNPKIFRGLCVLTALLSGISLASAFAPNSTFVQILLVVLITGMALAVQSGARHIPLRNKMPLWIGLGCGVLWLILGIRSGEWITVVLMILFQFAAGLAVAYGGRRTELGQVALVQILGLRKFMRSVGKSELLRLLKANPGYFHELAPYALALGVDRTFARRFARLRLPECTYLISPMQGQMTASEWAAFLRTTVTALDAKAKRLPFERLLGR